MKNRPEPEVAHKTGSRTNSEKLCRYGVGAWVNISCGPPRGILTQMPEIALKGESP